MKYLIICLLMGSTLLSGCSGRLNDQTQATTTAAVKPSLIDSIDHAILVYEQRLDIKMKRKLYEPKPNTLVTTQKWFEFGDTTRLVKMRHETLTNGSKMEIAQFHYINGKLTQIHDYSYDKQCAGGAKQCMTEVKYYFVGDTLFLALKRENTGTAASPPVIERAVFAPYRPAGTAWQAEVARQDPINKKWATLPYPKPRPERGSPVRTN